MSKPKITSWNQVRRGNIRRAMRDVAKEGGFADKIGVIKYRTKGPKYAGSGFNKRPIWGEYFPKTKRIELADWSPQRFAETGAHELAHAAGQWGEDASHRELQDKLYGQLRDKALSYAEQDKGWRRKSSSGWDESKHPRDDKGKWTDK